MFLSQDDFMMADSIPSIDDGHQREMTWQQQRDFGPAVVSEIEYFSPSPRALSTPHRPQAGGYKVDDLFRASSPHLTTSLSNQSFYLLVFPP
jgi:hypothetical protein